MVGNAELDRHAGEMRQARDQENEAANLIPDLGSYIRQRWQVMRNHRNQGNDPINNKLLRAQRMFEGRYDPDKLAEIQKFKGSLVYSRLVGVKCRGASSLLRDVYLGPERPWDIQPQPDPEVPAEVKASIMQLLSTETATLQQAGKPVLEDQIHMRFMGLMHAATAAARRNASAQADATSDKIEDMLVAGGFYEALTEFLTDLPLFPFACLKGPVVRMVPKLSWHNGKPKLDTKAQMFWERKSPFDIYWTPGASRIEEAEIIERKRLSRADLNDLLGLPGYDQDAIKMVLEDYGKGLREWLDAPDTEQALNEGRENPSLNQSSQIDALEYHGNIQGSMLIDQGMDPKHISDPERDYSVQAWVVGRYTIKVMMNPSPRQRHNYFLTSFEKVPGTVAGHALPDLLEDLQEITNATLRAMVNNLAISSGPQVVVNDEMLAPTEDGDDLYPWKRWHIASDPMGNQREPITFFQPQSNAQELLTVFQAITTMADEVSAIPRYMTGSGVSGGAGRTASGLSMLMGNAEKVLQTVAANVDVDVMRPLLSMLYDMIMLTDKSGLLTGEEEIRVRGVNVAMQKETERQKQLQFLQITANPIDAPIIGKLGRARVLRSIAADLGLPDDIVPDDQTLQAQDDAEKQIQAAQSVVQQQSAQAGVDPNTGRPVSPPDPSKPPPPASAPMQAGPPQAPPPMPQAPSPGPEKLSDHAPPVNLQQGIPMK